MKKIFSIYLLLILTSFCSAQSLNAISKRIDKLNLHHSTFNKIDLFNFHEDSLSNTDQIQEVIKKFSILEFNINEAVKIISEKPENILLSIPVSSSSSIQVELFKASLITPDFTVITGRNPDKPFSYSGGIHYWGIIKGDNSSVCAISIFKDEVMGMISSPSLGNFVLGKLKGDKNKLHILYNDKDIIVNPAINCFTISDTGKYKPQDLNTPSHISSNCIRLYWEMNYDIYIDKGSVTNTVNYAVGLFNQSAVLYANDSIPVELSQVYVWDTISPYNGTSTINLLNQFQAFRNSFTGDIGSLLGYSGGGGVAASINGICSSNRSYSQCYSGIMGSFQNVPSYSWDVEVITHEQGHIMGSRHTHACVWNGNNTAIDGCGPSAGYPYEGNCSGAPIPSNGGTIMSYCHLTSAGINFSLGFGPQPAAVILNIFNNASCLTTCTGGVFCSAATGMSTNNVTTTSADFNWTTVNGALSYRIQYRIVGSVSWITDSTTNNFYNATGLTPGSNYEWQIQTVCTGNSASYTNSTFFITVPLVCNSPIGINTTNFSSISANFNWVPAIAAIGYNIQYRLTGTLTWNTGTTTVNSYHAVGLIPNSNYEYQVQTICSGGGTSGFSLSNNFTTLDAGAPVTIILQPDAECGKDALIGNNVQSGYLTSNFGDNPEFNALAWTNGGSSNQRSLIQFDLSFIPSGSAVQSALLSFYWNPTSVNTGHSTSSGSNSALLREITSPWSESQVTWINQPGTTSLNQVILPASMSSNQDYLNIDITNMVQDFVNNPTTNYGMMIQEQSEIPYRSLVFASSDHPNSSLHPKLEVTYAPNISECLNFQYSNCEGVDALIGDCIVAGYDTSNFGTTTEFDALAWTYSNTNSDFRSLIFWNFSSIPVNAIVDSAKLTLFWNPNSSNVGHSAQSGPNDAYFEKITTAWSEDAVTWNSQPSTDTTNRIYLPASASTQQDYSIDVTSMIQDMVSNPSMNFGMMMKLKDESSLRSLVFCSSDHPDPAKHPRIDICYTVPNIIPSIVSKNGITIQQDYGSQTVFIKNSNEFENGTLFFLYSSDGKLIKRYDDLSGKLFSFHTSGFSTGVYFFKLISKSIFQSGKIILQ